MNEEDEEQLREREAGAKAVFNFVFSHSSHGECVLREPRLFSILSTPNKDSGSHLIFTVRLNKSNGESERAFLRERERELPIERERPPRLLLLLGTLHHRGSRASRAHELGTRTHSIKNTF